MGHWHAAERVLGAIGETQARRLLQLSVRVPMPGMALSPRLPQTTVEALEAEQCVRREGRRWVFTYIGHHVFCYLRRLLAGQDMFGHWLRKR